MAVKNFNRIACLILSLVLVFVLSSVSVFATEAPDAAIDTNESVEPRETYEDESADGTDAAPVESDSAEDISTDNTAPVDTENADDSAPVDTDKAEEDDTKGETGTTGNTEKETKKLTTGEIVSIVITLVIIIIAVVYCIKNRVKVAKFFRECKSEVKKITWTPKNQVAKNTFVVIVVVIIAAIFIAILDLLFSSGVGLLGNL